MEKPLTIIEAARFLSVSPWQVRQYIRDGLIRAYKLGNSSTNKSSRRRWRVWKADLIDFINKKSNIEVEL